MRKFIISSSWTNGTMMVSICFCFGPGDMRYPVDYMYENVIIGEEVQKRSACSDAARSPLAY